MVLTEKYHLERAIAAPMAAGIAPTIMKKCLRRAGEELLDKRAAAKKQGQYCLTTFNSS